jgi:hypothetical protein
MINQVESQVEQTSEQQHQANAAFVSSIKVYGKLVQLVAAAGILANSNLTVNGVKASPNEDLSMMTFHQAMRRKDANKWVQAMKEEFDSIMSKGLGTLVNANEVPPHIRPLTTRWVYKIKHNELLVAVRWKARLVVHGHKQKHGIDYDEVFAPTAKIKSIKMLLATTAHYDRDLDQADFRNAFLNGPLQETVYIKLPTGGCGDEFSGRILKLEKALYGLKQAPKAWYDELIGTLLSMSFVQSQADPCVFTKIYKRVDGTVIGTVTLGVYVDDTLISLDPSCRSFWTADKLLLSQKYELDDMGECKWLLGMSVHRDRTNKIIYLSQETYINGMLLKFGMNTVKPINIPIESIVVSEDVASELLTSEQHSTYRSMVGAIAWAAQLTRPDISFAVGFLSRQLHAPKQLHLQVARKLLRYLAGTANYCFSIYTW